MPPSRLPLLVAACSELHLQLHQQQAAFLVPPSRLPLLVAACLELHLQLHQQQAAFLVPPNRLRLVLQPPLQVAACSGHTSSWRL